MEKLIDQRAQKPHHRRDSASGNSDDSGSVRGAGGRSQGASGGRSGRALRNNNSVHQHDEMMKARYDVLQENNQQLEKQLQDLKQMMRKVRPHLFSPWSK